MPNSSTSCTFVVGPNASDGYHINLRREGDFADVPSVSLAFPEGHRVELLGDAAWWAPNLTTLWVEREQQLLAVQMFGFSGENDAALRIAEQLARLLAG